MNRKNKKLAARAQKLGGPLMYTTSSYHAFGKERRTWTNSVGTLVVAVVAGACFGLLIASVSGSVNLGIGAVTSTRSFPPAVVGPRQTPSSLVGFASRQQREAIERFKETGLRPGEKIKDPQEDTRTGRSIVADPVSIDVKDFDGKVIGSEDLALKVARPESARGLVHRYLMYAQNALRAGTASTKTRSEVRGGGKKPYQQKKTGNARQGSRRTPLRPGGGVIFGPKPRDFSVDMNQKERRIAMATAFQSASPDVVVVENLDGKFDSPKTKNMVEFLDRVGLKPSEEKVLLVIEGAKRNALLSARNIDRLKINKPNSLKITDVLGADKIVVEQGALNSIKSIFGAATASEPEAAQEEEAAPAAA
ncbi:hypothetical protein AAMO2058_001512000 [Amorphochlora amoebiformis]